MFKSATLVLVVTRAPASRQIRAAARSNGPPDCVGGRIAHRPSDGRPKALVSPLTREGPPRRRNGQYAGAALQDARHNKERIYPELVASGRCRLVVLALEIGGCWSQETCTFLRLLASHRERQAPQIIQQAVSTALLHRWSAMLTHAAATAYAASVQGCDGASEANVEGTPPSFSELLAQTPPEHPPASRLPLPAT